VTVYGPRCNVHPDRTGATRRPPYRLLVVHTSEGSEGTSSAENLCNFMTQPGDRPSTSGGKFGASYHYVTDTDRVIPAAPDNVVAYAAAGANNDGLHVCIPGKAGQIRAEWLDVTSRAYIGQLADVMRDKGKEFAIPMIRLNPAEIIAGRTGYCGHVDISRAYHKSDHTDPGVAFPWDVLADLLAPEEPPMATKYFKLAATGLAVWATSDDLTAVRLEGSQATARGVDVFNVPTLAPAEADKLVFLPGLPAAAVR
jgi:hypothetical protein